MSEDSQLLFKRNQLIMIPYLSLLNEGEVYANMLYGINFGHTVGIEEAAENYFHRPTKDLSQSQAATLCVIYEAPSYLKEPAKLLERRNKILEGLFNEGRINRQAFELEKSEPLAIFKSNN
jgi:membrane peptidoglycan carboxypeptidase